MGHKIPNWIKPQTYLQPKFQAPRSKIDLDRKIHVSLILYSRERKFKEKDLHWSHLFHTNFNISVNSVTFVRKLNPHDVGWEMVGEERVLVFII